MLIALTLVLFAAPRSISACPAPVVQDGTGESAVDAKIAAAGSDLPKLLALATEYSVGAPEADTNKIYKRILELDPNNEVAHKGLRHQSYGGKWFESFAELAKFKREEDAKMKEKGLARFKDGWVPERDVPFMTMGWTKDAQGTWSDPIEVARAKQVADWKTAGYQFRADDTSWIAPADFDHWKAIEWKCGNDWVDMAKANEYHSKIEQPWKLTGEYFVAWTTCEWEGANFARWHADKTYPDLVRLFGVEPAKPPHFCVVNSLQQYNQVAGNQPVLVESEGFSSLHGAYFADAFVDKTTQPMQFLGCGVSYWDRKDAKLAAWGPFWVRWAAAQSYVDAIDPSWSAVGQFVGGRASGELNAHAAAFWAEKKIPRWLRYGAASYVERYMKNPEAAEGADPWTLREFAFGEIKKNGGLRKLDTVFAFGLDINDIPGSSRLYHEAGLVVAYLLDGAPGDKELAAKHEAFKKSLKSGSKADVVAAATALQAELVKHEADIQKFAGL